MDHTAELEQRAAALVGVELAARAVQWVRDDPDDHTRTEVIRLVADEDAAGLTDRFSQWLEFGTAGLRGALGAGPNRMNRLVVRHAAAGLMAHLGEGASVVIGFDARHGSLAFAEETARVVAGAGGVAILLPGPHPTPLVPFAVRRFGTDSGVMVTASHNPPQDNGYKVYLGDGAQLVPPIDEAIAAEIAASAERDIPLGDLDHERVQRVSSEIFDEYLDMVDRCRLVPDSGGVSTAYTALHGVGRDLLVAAFDRAGFPAPHVVAEQAEPDPDFPSLTYPNPEEPEALQLVFALAERSGVDLVIAHDADADRLGVAVPGNDGWRSLTGNEIGALLADHILSHTTGDDRLVVTTVVSSRLLSHMAEAAGVRYADTLTGFKWIVRPALDDPTARLVFAYEEALGFLVTPEVRDKDGITAAVLFVEAAATLAASGRTVVDRLDELALEHGLHVTKTVALRFDGTDAEARMAGVMARVRSDPPTSLASLAVTRFDDLARGGVLAPTDAMVFELGERARVIVRPSNTEPKVKIYLEVVAPTTQVSMADDRRAARELVAELEADLADRLGITIA